MSENLPNPPAPIDPYAPKLPDAVRRQVERAEELARQAGVLNVPAPANGEAHPEGDNSGGDASGDGVTTIVSPGETTGFEGPTPTPAPVEEHPPTQTEWEQRYATLQGKYNSEIPELRGQVRAMQEMIAQLNMRRDQSPAPTPAPPPGYVNPPPIREIPSTDVESYGSDLIEASQRWSQAGLAPVLQAYERRILALEGAQQQVQQLTAGQIIQAELDREVPGWRQQNDDEGFLAWLRQADPFSGRSRQDLLNDAYGAGDARRTIAFFQAYRQGHTELRPALPGTQQFQTGGRAMPAPSAESLPLAELAVPGRGAVSTGPVAGAQSERRIWRRGEITAFFLQKQRGQWRGREADVARIEQDIIEAGREGRIIP